MSKLIFPDIPFFYIHELACPCCGQLPPDLYANSIYHDFFFKLSVIRRNWGKPITVQPGGGWRCPNYQYGLIIQKKTKATTSPHSFCAFDPDLNGKKETLKFVELIETMFPEMRMGYKKYLARGQSFVHLDECYKVKPRPSPTWVKGYRW